MRVCSDCRALLADFRANPHPALTMTGTDYREDRRHSTYLQIFTCRACCAQLVYKFDLTNPFANGWGVGDAKTP